MFIIQIALLVVIAVFFVFLVRKASRKTNGLNAAGAALPPVDPAGDPISQPANPPEKLSAVAHADKSIRQVAYVFIIINLITLVAYFFIKDKYAVEMWTIYASAGTLLISLLLLVKMPANFKLLIAVLLTISAAGNFIVRLPVMLNAKGILIFYAVLIPLFFLAMAGRALLSAWYIYKQKK